MKKSITIILISTVLMFTSLSSKAGLIFSFTESNGNVVMTSSGTFDTTGLLEVAFASWGGTGIQEYQGLSILGGNNVGSTNKTFEFNLGTDASEWAGTAWTTGWAGASTYTGTKAFSTYTRTNGSSPGLSVTASDLVNGVWVPDQIWVFNNKTFADLTMNIGTYTVTDAITNEFITFQVGVTSVPEPSTLAIFSLALIGLSMRKFKKNS